MLNKGNSWESQGTELNMTVHRRKVVIYPEKIIKTI